MRKIGLHVRIPHTILEALSYARKLNLPIFQFFLLDQIARRPLKIDQYTAQQFKEHAQAGHIPYVHGSYFINLAHLKPPGYKALKKEIAQAKQIGVRAIILHPGSATGSLTQQEGIAQLATIMNKLIKQEPDITFILENTAHGGKSVGSDILDFKKLKQMIDQPERLSFCIDTAHAHAYGYDLSTPEKQEAFIALLDDAIGIENIAERLLTLTDRLTAALREKGYRVISSRNPAEASGIVAFVSSLHDHDKVQAHLEAEHRIVIAVRCGRLRASPFSAGGRPL